MAAGDITRDTGFPRQVSNMWMLSGTIEVDDTKRAYALTDTNSRLISVFLIDEDGVGSAQVELNVNASGTATAGSAAVMGNHQSVDTYRFVAHYI